MSAVSPRRRWEVIDALRRGTVPSHGLDLLVVGLDAWLFTLEEDALASDPDLAAGGSARSNADEIDLPGPEPL